MVGESSDKLDGWKRIADHLGRTMRTVQRWERELDLPVYHAGRSKGYSVFAYKSELDQWLGMKQGGQLDSPMAADSDSGGGNRAEHSGTLRPHGRRALWLVAATATAACVTLAAIWFLKRTPAEIGAVAFSGQQLVAMSGGRVAWTYDFGQPLRSFVTPEQMNTKISILDLYGDGHTEILVAAPLLIPEKGDLSSDALYCFSSHGKALWKQAYDRTVRFGGEECGPRWEVGAVLVTGRGYDTRIWSTFCSYPMSVAVLTTRGARGNSADYFVNYGHLGSLAEFRTPAGSYILAGGINNEYDCAMVAVLKESGTSGRSPQTGSLGKCDHCPSGQPVRYLLFARSEINRAIGPPYNTAVRILTNGERESVMTFEANGINSENADWVLYQLSEEFIPVSVLFSDHYWEDHRKLSAESKINHRVDDCPERLKPTIVREWSPEHGWRSIGVPSVASK